ncbi:hypothetical protein HPB50_024903 [Hyalomma asiaticum]|uniref:Uncharacterized protein n=1 Tax=Hyalomma asiaticum TaxID=266040 RepID=A0ACB7T4W1_HYAAI|nr:hypothetical protein HPB50_024903 [Hyalomma asiaticum]
MNHSTFVRSSNHCLDLALQEVARNCDVIDDALDIVKDDTNAIPESKNWKNLFERCTSLR